MKKISLTKLRKLAKRANGYVDTIYVHWSAGRYHQFFDDYHINVDDDGSIYISTSDLTETLPHTWQRNSRAIGICFAGCYGAEPHNGFDTDFGDYPPTQAQMDGVCQAIAILCEELGLPVDYEHVKTHCEAAEEDDYGPSTTCERWDLWYLPDLPNEEAVKHGGEVIRGKTAWWQKKTDHNI